MDRLSSLVDSFRRDARYTVRVLGRSPLFTLAAVLTLAVGIGANAAIFSVVDTLLLRPLPYPEPDRLFVVSTTFRSDRGSSEQTSQTGRTWEMLRDHARTVDMAPFSNWTSGVNLFAGGKASHVRQQRVGAGFFRVLGVPPLQGREITEAEDVPGGRRVVVLSHDLWQRTFDGDASVLGREVLLKGEPHTVVGVAPPEFRSTAAADLWTPLRPSTTGEGEGTNYGILLRPRAGTSVTAAEAEIAALGEQALREQGRNTGDTTARLGLMPLGPALVGGLEQPLFLLWGVAGLVLLVVCANLASLMLARWSGRSREIAARLALGSGRSGVLRQVLAESLALAVAGTVVGIGLGHLALAALADLARQTLGIWQPVALDGRVVAMSAGLALVAALLFGLGPALRTTRVDVRSALAAGGRGTASVGAGSWLRRVLVVGEVAVGVLLVVFAGVLLRSFFELRGLEPGLDAVDVTTGTLSLQDARYEERAAVDRLFTESLDRLRAQPGVEAAAVSLGLPFQRPLNLGFRLAGAGEDEMRAVSALYVTPGYFETLRVPLLRGRDLSPADAAAAPAVAVVNRAFVERFLAPRDGEGKAEAEPLGRRLAMLDREIEVVGVVGDVLVNPAGLGGRAPLAREPLVYLPVRQVPSETLAMVHTWFQPYWIVRSPLPVGTVTEALEDAVAAVDPRLPFAAFRSLEEVAGEALGMQRFLMVLVVSLATVALLLAAVGIYGLVAGSVVERTRELGIRLALGARREQALRSVFLPGLGLALGGVAVGLGFALSGARLVRSLVHGVSPTDPAAMAAGAGLLLLVTVAATLLPALRVLHLDPARTLREE